MVNSRRKYQRFLTTASSTEVPINLRCCTTFEQDGDKRTVLPYQNPFINDRTGIHCLALRVAHHSPSLHRASLVLPHCLVIWRISRHARAASRGCWKTSKVATFFQRFLTSTWQTWANLAMLHPSSSSIILSLILESQHRSTASETDAYPGALGRCADDGHGHGLER
jgi:hypothetical protein